MKIQALLSGTDLISFVECYFWYPAKCTLRPRPTVCSMVLVTDPTRFPDTGWSGYWLIRILALIQIVSIFKADLFGGTDLISWMESYFRYPAKCALRPLPTVCSTVTDPAGDFRHRVWFSIFTKLGKIKNYQHVGFILIGTVLYAVCARIWNGWTIFWTENKIMLSIHVITARVLC
jgi:hypothetical protein